MIESESDEDINKIDFRRFFSPIQDDNECGKDVSYTYAYSVLKNAYAEDYDKTNRSILQGEIKVPDWNLVKDTAQKILTQQSKDLWVFLVLLDYSYRKSGVEIFLANLKYLCDFLAKYEYELYPKNKTKFNNVLDSFFKKFYNYINKHITEDVISIYDQFETQNNTFSELRELAEKLAIDSNYLMKFLDLISEQYAKLKFQKNTNIMVTHNVNVLNENTNQMHIKVTSEELLTEPTGLILKIDSVDEAYEAIKKLSNYFEKTEPRQVTYLVLELVEQLKKFTVKDLVKLCNEENSPMRYLSQLICR